MVAVYTRDAWVRFTDRPATTTARSALDKKLVLTSFPEDVGRSVLAASITSSNSGVRVSVSTPHALPVLRRYKLHALLYGVVMSIWQLLEA